MSLSLSPSLSSSVSSYGWSLFTVFFIKERVERAGVFVVSRLSKSKVLYQLLELRFVNQIITNERCGVDSFHLHFISPPLPPLAKPY